MAAKDYHKNELVFKAVTAFRIVVGVAFTLAVLFAMVWLIDYSSESSSPTYNQQTLMLPDNAEENKPSQASTFFETLLNKKEKKAGDAVGGVKNETDTQPGSQLTTKSSKVKKPDSYPVMRSTEASGAQAGSQQAQPAKRSSGAASVKEVFTVQLGSFQQAERAKVFSENLAVRGYQPYILNTVMPNGTTTYRVRIGRYATREEAMASASRIEAKEKISVFVTSK